MYGKPGDIVKRQWTRGSNDEDALDASQDDPEL